MFNNKIRFTFVLIYSLICYCNSQLSSVQQAEQNLLTVLLTGYNKNVRPDDTVDLTTTVSLKQIISIDEKNQIMTSTCYISQSWKDPRLTWTPGTYSNIDIMMIAGKSIWLPDTFIMNTADTDGYLKLNSDFSLISVHNDGTVYFILPVVALKTRCVLYTKSFPFDSQVCKISFSSWAQGSNRIKYAETQYTVDVSDYTDSPIWNLVATKVTSSLSADRVPFEEANNTNINVEFYLKRKPLFFMMNGVFACLILNCLTLLLFCMPIAQQLALGCTIFMTYSVYSLSFSNATPSQSDFIPLITLYFVLSISFTLICMCWFCILHQLSSTQSAPGYLLKFCGLLQKVFCCFENHIWQSCNCKINRDANGELARQMFEIKVQNFEQSSFVVVNQSKKEVQETELKQKPKCNFCDRCNNCQKDYEKSKETSKNKKEFESKMSALNYFVFIILLLYCIVFQLAVWLSLS